MLQATLTLLKGQYRTRLKKRMVGFIPKVVPRKIRNNMMALRSEANTGYFEASLKTEAERTDTSGKKTARVLYDPVVGRYAVFRDTKIKGPFLTKTHVVTKAPEAPYQMKG